MRRHLSPRELAAAIGMSESSLRRWADDGRLVVARTAGGHRRISIGEAVRFIRDSSLPVIQPELLGLPAAAASDPAAEPDHVLASSTEAIYDALMQGAADRAVGLAVGQFIGGQTVAAICDGPLRQAMSRIGEIWRHGEEGIFYEHRATDACIRVLNQLRELVGPVDGAALKAVGGAPSGDPYLLPSLMASTVLTETGMSATNLGPDTPLPVLRRAASDVGAALVWLSISVEPDTPPELASACNELGRALASERTAVVVGGRGLSPVAAQFDRRLVHVVNSMQELHAYAVGLVAGRRVTPAPSTEAAAPPAARISRRKHS